MSPASVESAGKGAPTPVMGRLGGTWLEMPGGTVTISFQNQSVG